VIVHFVDIGGIEDHRCLNFHLFFFHFVETSESLTNPAQEGVSFNLQNVDTSLLLFIYVKHKYIDRFYCIC
jgi:hypothetical protein